MSKRVFIVQELAQNGEMFAYLSKRKFGEDIGRFFLEQLIKAMHYYTTRGICHRDLKSANIVFDDQFNCKIIDFGFADLLRGTIGDGKMREICGTPNYAAPEIMEEHSAYYGRQVDIFSLGVTLFEMCTGFLPFEQATKEDERYK